MATGAEAAAALSALGDRVVLVLDTYEQLRLLDTWLRQELVPGLRDNTRLALAGREPPVTAWISDFGDLLATVPLANLAAADAGALLRREGLSGADAARVTRFTHGHPLALRLAASARGARQDLTVPDAAIATSSNSRWRRSWGVTLRLPLSWVSQIQPKSRTCLRFSKLAYQLSNRTYLGANPRPFAIRGSPHETDDKAR